MSSVATVIAQGWMLVSLPQHGTTDHSNAPDFRCSDVTSFTEIWKYAGEMHTLSACK